MEDILVIKSLNPFKKQFFAVVMHDEVQPVRFVTPTLRTFEINSITQKQ